MTCYDLLPPGMPHAVQTGLASQTEPMVEAFSFPTFARVAEVLIGIAGAASNVAKKNSTFDNLKTIGLRFSPNSRLTPEMPVLRPVLVALQLAQLDTETKCLLAVSLGEAESLRWAFEKFDTQTGLTGLSFCLHIVSECDSVNKAPWFKWFKSFHNPRLSPSRQSRPCKIIQDFQLH